MATTFAKGVAKDVLYSTRCNDPAIAIVVATNSDMVLVPETPKLNCNLCPIVDALYTFVALDVISAYHMISFCHHMQQNGPAYPGYTPRMTLQPLFQTNISLKSNKMRGKCPLTFVLRFAKMY